MNKSVIFWNTIGVIAQLITLVISWETLAIFHVLVSIMLLASMVDDSDVYDKWPYCLRVTWLSIFGVIVVGIGISLYKVGDFIYVRTIKKFNNWLDTK
jgi:hypothetical protein